MNHENLLLVVNHYRFDAHEKMFREGVWKTYPVEVRECCQATRDFIATILKNQKLRASYEIIRNEYAGIKETCVVSASGGERLLKVELRYNANDEAIHARPAHRPVLPASHLCGMVADLVSEAKTRQFCDHSGVVVSDEAYVLANLQNLLGALAAEMLGSLHTSRYGTHYTLYHHQNRHTNIDITVQRGKRLEPRHATHHRPEASV